MPSRWHAHSTPHPRCDAILGALVDREDDVKPFLARIVFADCRDDAHVRVAVLEIETAQQIAVGFNAVGIVDVGGLQEAEPVAFRGLDDVAQAPDEKALAPTNLISLTPVSRPR